MIEDIGLPKLSTQKCSPKHLVFSDVSFYDDMMYGTPPSGEGGLNGTGVAKYSDFGLIEGYISETVPDRW